MAAFCPSLHTFDNLIALNSREPIPKKALLSLYISDNQKRKKNLATKVEKRGTLLSHYFSEEIGHAVNVIIKSELRKQLVHPDKEDAEVKIASESLRCDSQKEHTKFYSTENAPVDGKRRNQHRRYNHLRDMTRRVRGVM